MARMKPPIIPERPVPIVPARRPAPAGASRPAATPPSSCCCWTPVPAAPSWPTCSWATSTWSWTCCWCSARAAVSGTAVRAQGRRGPGALPPCARPPQARRPALAVDRPQGPAHRARCGDDAAAPRPPGRPARGCIPTNSGTPSPTSGWPKAAARPRCSSRYPTASATPAWWAARVARPVAASPRPYRIATLLVGRRTRSKAGTALRPWGRPSSSPVSGWRALEHPPEAGRRCFALQPQGGGAGAVPPPRGLAVAGQVRLVVGRQLAEVVVLPPHRELGHVGHHPAASSPPLAPANAPVVHWSPRMISGGA
jgi:hypothetical protein